SATRDQDVRKAVELLDEAVKRDPSFFDAYYQLAYAHEYLYAQTGVDHTPARLALAEAALQAATRLRLDAGGTHLARAQYLYFGQRDYDGALAELETARRTLPNDPRLFELSGYILRRRGDQEEGLRNLQRAVEIDRVTFGRCNRSRLVINCWVVMASRSLHWIGRLASCPTMSKCGLFVQNLNCSGERIVGRSTKRLIQSSRKGRAPLLPRRIRGFSARWLNAIRLRPNARSLPSVTMTLGPKARLI